MGIKKFNCDCEEIIKSNINQGPDILRKLLNSNLVFYSANEGAWWDWLKCTLCGKYFLDRTDLAEWCFKIAMKKEISEFIIKYLAGEIENEK